MQHAIYLHYIGEKADVSFYPADSSKTWQLTWRSSLIHSFIKHFDTLCLVNLDESQNVFFSN